MGNWLEYDIPSMLWLTSGIILVSSAFMQWAYIAAKKNKTGASNCSLSYIVLGIVFLLGQLQAWDQLVGLGVFFVGNSSRKLHVCIYWASWYSLNQWCNIFDLYGRDGLQIQSAF